MCVCVYVYQSMEVCILDVYMGNKVSRNLTWGVLETFSYLGFYVDNFKLVIVKTILKNILDLKNGTLKMNLF